MRYIKGATWETKIQQKNNRARYSVPGLQAHESRSMLRKQKDYYVLVEITDAA